MCPFHQSCEKNNYWVIRCKPFLSYFLLVSWPLVFVMARAQIRILHSEWGASYKFVDHQISLQAQSLLSLALSLLTATDTGFCCIGVSVTRWFLHTDFYTQVQTTRSKLIFTLMEVSYPTRLSFVYFSIHRTEKYSKAICYPYGSQRTSKSSLLSLPRPWSLQYLGNSRRQYASPWWRSGLDPRFLPHLPGRRRC